MIIEGIPNGFTIPVMILGVIAGWIMILWLMREFEVFGEDKPEDPAAGLKRADHER
jgi:hypothetical protein